MTNHIDDAHAIEVLERYCGWLAIPHGLTKDKKYIIRARLMFKQGGMSIRDEDIEVLQKVFDNWPRFLSHTQWRPKLYLAFGDKPELRVAKPLDPIGKLYVGKLTTLADGDSRINQVCELWRAAFPDAGKCETYAPPVQANYHDNMPFAKAADALGKAYGGLHALSLASSLNDRGELITHAGRIPVNFANKSSTRPFMRSAYSIDEAISNFGSMINGPADRYIQIQPEIETKGQKKDVFNRWLEAVLGAETPWKLDSVNISAKALGESGGLGNVLKSILYTLPDTKPTRKCLEEQIFAIRADAKNAKLCTLRLASMMREISHHGWLLRQFGLVVEFEIPESDWALVQQNVEDFKPGSVVVTCESSGHPVGNPEGTGFPQRSGVVLLNSPGPRFELMQLDVQSSARKLVQTVMTYNSKRDSAASPGEKTYETAAQRTGGIALVDRDTLKRKKKQSPNKKPLLGLELLYGEDITLGIRPDVQTLQLRENAKPIQSSWKSLTGWKIRSAHLEVGPLKGRKDVTDYLEGIDAGEGVIGEASRLVSDGNKVGAISYDDVFTWDGWSLAVGHPDPGASQKRPAYSTLKVGSLIVTLEARGDLPVLRIGHGYLVGVRVVYIDGSSLSLPEAVSRYGCEKDRPVVGLSGSGGSAFFPYLRHEPIAPPDIHLGECVDYAHFPQVSTKKAVLASSSTHSNVRKFEVRYFVPPAISLEQAITLGMYDSEERRAQPPQSAFSGICLTPAGRFPNVANRVFPRDEAPARASTIGDQTDTIFHRSIFARKPTIPYLPDPWAKRLIIAAYRASDNELLAWEFHDYYAATRLVQWPNCEPLRLEIRRSQDIHLSQPRTYGSAQGRVDFHKEGATLQLSVPAGEDIRIRAWHEVDERILGQSAIVDQMADYLRTEDARDCCLYLGIDPKDNKRLTRDQLIHCLSNWRQMRHDRIRSQVSRNLANGLTNITSFGMINPDEVMTVVHAVDCPPAPRFLWSGLASEEVAPNVAESQIRLLPAARLRSFEQSVRMLREPARTDAQLAGDLEIDRPTTRRVDISFSWSDPVDDLTKQGPETHEKNAILHIDPIPPVLTHRLDPLQQTPNARSTPDLAEDDSLILLSGVRTALKRTTNEDLHDKKLSVAFGDTRARIVDITAVAQSRFAEEFKKESSSFFSAPGKIRQLVCPSSACPAVPSIDFVMPQYQWLEKKSGHQAHERVGGCFRIWLNRPWFSSGVGERLAVVCWPATAFDKSFVKERLYQAFAELCGVNNDPPPFLESFVTRWGEDPLWTMNTKACIGSIPPEAFRRHVCDHPDIAALSKSESCFPILDLRECEAVKPHLASFENAPSSVALVLYEPVYDRASRRYFVDVQIDERYAYYPFVRLALARYQQYALPGFELSEITSHEFVQLPPTRRTELDVLGINGNSVDVSVRLIGPLPATSKELCNNVERTDWDTQVIARLEYLPIKAWEKLRTSVPESLGPFGVAWVPEYETTEVLCRKDPRVWEVRKKFTLGRDRMYSIVIEECELGFQDDRSENAQQTKGFCTPVKPLARRVFADRLLLPNQS